MEPSRPKRRICVYPLMRRSVSRSLPVSTEILVSEILVSSVISYELGYIVKRIKG